ncbi:MAG: hypothetical protein H6718_10135 [Polyangiaceae bacterium]|nr:hypothetical protein [Myxococcales bacterium]MCB9585749.1 hypothetical protein [Polyangiaceae bacterium]MCB9607322.1 hypothetical protein [Polyangiaceae bacterium]
MRKFFEYFVAGGAIYVVMAACSSAGSSGSPHHGPGGGGSGGSLTDPVPNATANESGSRLRANYYAGQDGSRQFVGWHDTQRNEDCTMRNTKEGPRCLPVLAAADIVDWDSNEYSDPECTVVAYNARSYRCEGTVYLVEGSTDECRANDALPSDTDFRVWQMDQLQQPTIYQISYDTDRCQPKALEQGRDYFVKGPEVPLTDFAGATVLRE